MKVAFRNKSPQAVLKEVKSYVKQKGITYVTDYKTWMDENYYYMTIYYFNKIRVNPELLIICLN